MMLMKVIYMLAVHELEEIYIGDLTHLQIDKKEKVKIGHEAVSKVLGELAVKDKITNIINEFDERKTNEALFAHYCDKLECDIQSKLYDLEGCVDLNKQENNTTYNNDKVQKFLQEGKSWSDMWLLYGQERYNYDENFLAVSDYVKDNKIIK